MSDTLQLYSTDSYLKEIKAKITEITDTGLVLDQTIFYPQGGGQPRDQGTITNSKNNIEVNLEGLKKDQGKIIHLIASEKLSEFSTGDEVNLVVDWDYRYVLMKHHTALHVLSAVVYRKYEAKVTGGNIYPNKARLDFDLSEFNKDLAQELVDETNEEIRKDHVIEIEFLPREEADKRPELIRTKINLLPASISEIRTVKIGDIDLQADGGLHVLSTKEIGEIELLKVENKGKGRKRISIGVKA